MLQSAFAVRPTREQEEETRLLRIANRLRLWRMEPTKLIYGDDLVDAIHRDHRIPIRYQAVWSEPLAFSAPASSEALSRPHTSTVRFAPRPRQRLDKHRTLTPFDTTLVLPPILKCALEDEAHAVAHGLISWNWLAPTDEACFV